MGHKFLAAIDDSDSSMKIANYLRSLLKPDDMVTIYTVVPNPAVLYDFNDPSVSPIFLQNKAFFTEFENNIKKLMNRILGKVKKKLITSGLDESRINIKLETQNNTIAHHIINEAVKGKYNTIVIGKHNSSRLSEILLGDVTHKVIHHAKDIPVIVV